MVNTTMLFFVLLILFNIVFFVLGFLVGNRNSSQPVFGSQQNKIIRSIPTNPITIDESKVVTDINLSGLEKKYETLGDTKTSHETINSSVDKLKNLKR